MGAGRFRVVLLTGCAAGLTFTSPMHLRAQQVLPEITVTAPTPIAPQRGPGPQATAAPPPAGTLPILEYVFSPLTVVLEQDIRSTPANTVGDILFTAPGVTTTGYIPGAASRPVIRGLDNFRVRVQENGVGAFDVSAIGEDHPVAINPLIANQIEVIRGPATLRWGSTAIGGVVSVDNGRIPTQPNRGLTGEMRGAIAAVDRSIQGATILEASSDHYALYFDAFGRRAEDYNTPLGRQANSFQRTNGQSLGATAFLPNGYVGFNIAYTEGLYGIPGEGAADNKRIDFRQLKFTSKGEFRAVSDSIDAIRFWFGAADYRHHEIADDPTPMIGSTYKNREQEARLEFQLTPRATSVGLLNTAIGFQLNNQHLNTEGEAGELLAPAHTISVASYVFNELQFAPAWRLQAAARIETVHVDGTAGIFPADFLPPVMPYDLPLQDVRRNFLPVSVSAGLLRDLPWQMVARANVQYAERAPSAAELFSKGPHEATGTFEIGNPNLAKEAATSFEIGLRRARGAFRFDASAFHTRYRGFIYKRVTGTQCGDAFDTCGVETELDQIVFTQQDANFTGVEVAAQLDLLPVAGGVFGVDAQYDFVQAKFSDGSNVPRIPPQRIGAGLFWRDGNWLMRVNYLHALAQTRIAPQETPTGSYDLVKAEISYTRRMDGPGGPRLITVGLVGNNLLNDEIRNHISFNKNEVLAPGRDVRLFANIRF